MNLTLSCLLFVIFIANAGVFADVIELKQDSKRHFGVTIDESTDSIVLLIYSNTTETPLTRTFNRDHIRRHIRTVDLSRLEALTDDRMSEYRDYAEELANVTEDPVARKIAIRLFAICLAHGDDQLKKSAALNLPALANTEVEKKRFNALAYIYAGKQITNKSPTHTSVKDSSSHSHHALLSFIQELRREDYGAAAEKYKQPVVQNLIKLFGIVTPDEIESALTAEAIGPNLKFKLLRLESDLILGKALSRSANSLNHLEAFEIIPATNVALPPVENTFEFDLDATRFRDGQWFRPSSK